jgi:hypothetical protein
LCSGCSLLQQHPLMLVLVLVLELLEAGYYRSLAPFGAPRTPQRRRRPSERRRDRRENNAGYVFLLVVGPSLGDVLFQGLERRGLLDSALHGEVRLGNGKNIMGGFGL